MREIHLKQPETVLNMLKDAALNANGGRDKEFMKFRGLVEEVAILRSSFTDTDQPTAVDEVTSYLRNTLQLYVKMSKFVFDQEWLRDMIPLPEDMMHELARTGPVDDTSRAILNHIHSIKVFLESKHQNFDLIHCFTNLCIHNLLYFISIACHTYFAAPMAVNDIHDLGVRFERKNSTAKARVAKQAEAQTTHDNIIKIFNDLKQKNPEISKNKASLMIGDLGKICLSPQVIRKHLNNV